MSTWILLLRGINVGGKNRLPMSDLVAILESFGLEDVETYIQSGNVVFRSAKASSNLGNEIAAAVEERHGFRPRVLLLDADRLREAAESNPFPEAEAEPGTLHLFFLASAPESPDEEALTAVASPSERFHLAGDVFYLHAPEGIGRSKLVANVEKHLGVAATARNWRTVERLREMSRDR